METIADHYNARISDMSEWLSDQDMSDAINKGRLLRECNFGPIINLA